MPGGRGIADTGACHNGEPEDDEDEDEDGESEWSSSDGEYDELASSLAWPSANGGGALGGASGAHVSAASAAAALSGATDDRQWSFQRRAQQTPGQNPHHNQHRRLGPRPAMATISTTPPTPASLATPYVVIKKLLKIV